MIIIKTLEDLKNYVKSEAKKYMYEDPEKIAGHLDSILADYSLSNEEPSFSTSSRDRTDGSFLPLLNLAILNISQLTL